MKKMMKVSVIGLNFDPKENEFHKILCFPEGTEILSVEIRDNNPTLWINFMAPSESFEIDISKKIHFAICKCEYDNFKADCHKYIGNVSIHSTKYAVFYN